MQAAVSLEHNKKCAFLSASSESSINIFNTAIYDKHFTWITVSTSHTRNEPVIYIAYYLSEGSDRSTDRVGLFRKQEKSGVGCGLFLENMKRWVGCPSNTINVSFSAFTPLVGDSYGIQPV